jgi:poly-gamma-glutamate synthesis protein (capsule biosynthesis protein)
LFVPEHLRRNVLAAISELEAAGKRWRWNLADSRDQADISLVPGDMGIPAGFRPVALTVPYDADWYDIPDSEAIEVASGGSGDMVEMDWADMSPERRALRVNGLLPHEEDYPLRQEWSLIAAESYEVVAIQLAQHLRNTIQEDRLIRLTAVGDLMLDRAIGYAIERGDLSFPFGAVSETLESGDITVGNFESALGNRGQPQNKSYTFRAPPAAVEALSRAGFDVLSLANNHAMDYGPEALEQALKLFHQRGIAAVGAGPDAAAARAPFTFDVHGLTVSFLSYVDVPIEVTGFDTRNWTATQEEPGVAWAEVSHIQEDVAAAKASADLVVVLLHSGYEYVEAPSPEQMLAARAAIEAGATLVLGHHAHVLQGIEFGYQSAIVYGLGNFAFEIDGDPTTMIANVWLDPNGVRQIELVPAIIEAGGRPRLAEPWEASVIRQRVFYLSSLLNSEP